MTATRPAMPISDGVRDIETWSPIASDTDFEFEYIDIASIDREQKVITTTTRTRAPDAPSRARQIVQKGDVLVSTVRPGLNAVATVPESLDGAIASTGFTVLRSDERRLHGPYLFHWVRSTAFVDEMVRLATGASYPAVSDRIVKNSSIPIPFPDDPRRSLAEQKRIAAILDKADAIRRRRQEAARLADTLIPSVFYEMFGDPLINARKWPTESLDQVAQLDRGRSRHRPRDWAPLYGGPYPLIQTGDIANCNGVIRKHTQTYSEEGLAQSKLWPKGTLCITIAANIGKTGILAFDACFPDSVVGLVAGPRLTIEYVREWFEAIQKNLDNSAPQVAQKNINLAILNALQIPVPPKPLQERFSQIVESVRAAQERAMGVDAQAGSLFDALVQRAFRGEL